MIIFHSLCFSFNSKEPQKNLSGKALITEGYNQGEELARWMRPTVRGLLDAQAELRQYKDHFVGVELCDAVAENPFATFELDEIAIGVELDENEKIDDVHLAATLTTADLQKMLPDAPLRHVLMLHRTFTSASRDGYAGVASASGTSSGQELEIVLPVLVKLMVKFIVEDEEHAREGNVLLVRPAYHTTHTCSL